jgi:hypothetical protein
VPVFELATAVQAAQVSVQVAAVEETLKYPTLQSLVVNLLLVAELQPRTELDISKFLPQLLPVQILVLPVPL